MATSTRCTRSVFSYVTVRGWRLWRRNVFNLSSPTLNVRGIPFLVSHATFLLPFPYTYRLDSSRARPAQSKSRTSRSITPSTRVAWTRTQLLLFDLHGWKQLFGAHTHFQNIFIDPIVSARKRRRRDMDMKRERKKETFRRQRHHPFSKCTSRHTQVPCPTTKCTHTAQLRSDWWWRWCQNVSFFLSLSLHVHLSLLLFVLRFLPK